MPRRDRVEEYPDELLERLKRVHDHGDMFAHLIEKANRDEEAVRVLSGARHLEMDIHPKLAFEFHLLARLRGEPGFRAYHLQLGRQLWGGVRTSFLIMPLAGLSPPSNRSRKG